MENHSGMIEQPGIVVQARRGGGGKWCGGVPTVVVVVVLGWWLWIIGVLRDSARGGVE